MLLTPRLSPDCICHRSGSDPDLVWVLGVTQRGLVWRVFKGPLRLVICNQFTLNLGSDSRRPDSAVSQDGIHNNHREVNVMITKAQ